MNKAGGRSRIDSVDIQLTDIEARVLGSLVEKEITTPGYYPLSLNALVNACNQKSNRDPVMNLDEDAVREALAGLHDKRIAAPITGGDSRVSKYKHRLPEIFNFGRPETAVLCVLLLRGPQTPGELRGRTERMYHFEDLSSVESALNHMLERQPPLVTRLPRQPGTKESRYAHLLCGDVESWEAPAEADMSAAAASANDERIARLEGEVAELRREMDEFKQQFAQFKKQFE